MKISRDYLEQAHAQQMYVDRLTGECFPAISREDFMSAIESSYVKSSKRLYYCNACVLSGNCDKLNSKVMLLQSYSTIVAAYLERTGTLFIFDYYSPTTCQHVAKFRTVLKASYSPLREVRLYNRVRDKVCSHIELEPFVPFT